MEIINIKIDELKPAEYNPRKWPKKAVDDLTNSIKEFGLIDPIIVNSAPERKNIVVGGHFRLQIAKNLSYEMVPVVYVNIPDIRKEQELNLRLNKNLGEWDYDLLANFDDRILLDAGFGAEELDEIFQLDVKEDDFDAQSEYDKIQEPITKLGDLYQLGNHRLLCGDSTKREDIEKLFAGGGLADMVFTDPPYNVNYNYAKYVDGRKMKWKKIFNDNKTSEQYYQFLLDVFKNVYNFSKDSMSFYVCHATKTQWENWAAFKDAGFHFSQTIIWLKERFILGLGQDWHRIYEPILFGWKEGGVHYKNKNITNLSEFWTLDKNDFEEELDIWYLSRDKAKLYEHPTQKPVRLPERAIKKNCPRDGLVFEPFCGSGSTLIACEQLKRKCYGCELDPKYCDVIVKRWERLTQKKAEKIN